MLELSFFISGLFPVVALVEYIVFKWEEKSLRFVFLFVKLSLLIKEL